jgi:hypothetical protein
MNQRGVGCRHLGKWLILRCFHCKEVAAVQKTDAFLPFKGCLYYLKLSNRPIFVQRRSHSGFKNSKLRSLTRPQFVSLLRVRTHQQSRVESKPVQSDSQRRGSDSVACLQWQTRQCVHTSRVESSRVTWALPSQESWYRMFHFRQSDSSDRAWRLLSWGRNGCGKVHSFS